jgi:hypothetical protein
MKVISDCSSEFTEIPFDELQFDNSGRPIGRGTFSDVYKYGEMNNKTFF